MSSAKTIAKRIVAFIIDWNLIMLLCFAMFLISPNFDVKYLMVPSTEMFSAHGVILGLLGLAVLPLIRDCIFRNASLGKLIMGLRVVDQTTGQPPRLGKLLLRNLTFYLCYIEFIVMLVNRGVSLGDMLSGTTVTEKNGKGENHG